MVIDRASSSLEGCFVELKRHEYKNSNNSLVDDQELCEIKTTVPCALKFRPQHNRPKEYYVHSCKWKSKERQKLKIDLEPSVGVAIASQLTRFKEALCLKRFEVTCFATAKLDGVLYRASPYYRGHAWYDWCVIPFDQNGVTEEFPCRIISFAKFPKGYPTPAFEEEYFPGCKANEVRRLIKEDIAGYQEKLESYHDYRLYAIIDSSQKAIDDNLLCSRFVQTIDMGESENLYIIDVNSISRPILSVPDFGDNKSRRFFISLPYRRWKEHFRHLITMHAQSPTVTNNDQTSTNITIEEFVKQKRDQSLLDRNSAKPKKKTTPSSKQQTKGKTMATTNKPTVTTNDQTS